MEPKGQIRPAASRDQPAGRLDSWKEVAAYLGRSEKTVRRWEEKEGLPIHRLHHDKRGSVYGYKHELDSWWELRKATIETEEAPTSAGVPAVQRKTLPGPVWMLAGMLLAAVAFTGVWLRIRPGQALGRNVQFQRITDFVGLEESPAISPDGKTVAFVARAGGRRHIWIRLLAGGTPLQITRDDADHEQPRWTPDSSSLLYYSPSAKPGDAGTIWEVSALGGVPRRVASALGGGDASHDGRRVALFRFQKGRTELAVAALDGTGITAVAQMPAQERHEYPRWSPDDRWIAFQSSNVYFDKRIYAIPAVGGPPRQVAHGDDLRGFSWLADGAGVVYSSSAGSTILYPPIFNLRTIRLDGTSDRQLTFGDVSYVEPDLQAPGKLVASRFRIQSDIWKLPVEGPAVENTRRGTRITEQTGQVQTPSVSPDDQEVVYLSDSGGHGNLWVARTDGSGTRQITFERDPATAVGVPVWSPAGNQIVFVLTRNGQTALWLVHSDGSGLRQVMPAGVWAYWSPDGRWLYYVALRNGVHRIEKAHLDGGTPVVVRSDDAVAPAVDTSILYYAAILKHESGGWDYEMRRSSPEDGKFQVLARIAGARIPVEPVDIHMILSPDGKWLATPLTDGATTNLWLLPVGGGEMRQITDFGKRSTLIARRISWSPDSRHIYAAVADCDADIVLLDGLVP